MGRAGNGSLRGRFYWTAGWGATEGSRVKGGVVRALAQNGSAGCRRAQWVAADWTRQGSLVLLVTPLYCALLGVSTAKPQGIFRAVKALDLLYLQPSRAPLAS